MKTWCALILAALSLVLLAGLRALVFGAPALGWRGFDVAASLTALAPTLTPLAGIVNTLAALFAALVLSRLYGFLSRLGVDKLDRPWALACEAFYALAALALVPLLLV